MKILYIEDYKNIHDMTLDILRDIEPDAEIVSYHDVPDCSELSDDTDYDFIISDCDLPSGNICISDCFTSSTKPIILVTGDTDIKCSSNNTTVCYKPYTPDELRESINKIKRKLNG